MPEFKSLTQTTELQSFNAPSGLVYISRKGDYFSVVDARDVAFFDKKNTRFVRKGAIAKLVEVVKPKKPVVYESADLVLEKWAEGLNGITKKDAKALAESYNELAEIVSDLEQGYDIHCDVLSDKKKAIIRKALGFDVDGAKLED